MKILECVYLYRGGRRIFPTPTTHPTKTKIFFEKTHTIIYIYTHIKYFYISGYLLIICNTTILQYSCWYRATILHNTCYTCIWYRTNTPYTLQFLQSRRRRRGCTSCRSCPSYLPAVPAVQTSCRTSCRLPIACLPAFNL